MQHISSNNKARGNHSPVWIALSIFILSGSFSGSIPRQDLSENFSFKQGVALNHFTSYPIKGWTYADSSWFNGKDAAWIAAAGLDHIQLFVSCKEITNEDLSLNLTKLAAVDSVISWCKKASLGTIISLVQFPVFSVDTTLTKEQQQEILLNKQSEFWGRLAGHFKFHGPNLRFVIDNVSNGGAEARNIFYKGALAEIRKTNITRKIYLTASSNQLDDLRFPEKDRNICIAAEMAVGSDEVNEALDVFLYQHAFRKKIASVTFPGTIPALDSLRKDHWARKYSNTVINASYLDAKFRRIRNWMASHHPGVEFYISHWRYFTGYPYNPATTVDENSIRNFGAAFSATTSKYQISWCIYDYNSGSCIRYPNGHKALILESLKLKD